MMIHLILFAKFDVAVGRFEIIAVIAGPGWTISHFRTFSGEMELNCALMRATPLVSSPVNCR